MLDTYKQHINVIVKLFMNYILHNEPCSFNSFVAIISECFPTFDTFLAILIAYLFLAWKDFKSL